MTETGFAPVRSSLPRGSRTSLSRILLDLAEGRLDDDELEAVARWLSADDADPPERIVELGRRAHARACAGFA